MNFAIRTLTNVVVRACAILRNEGPMSLLQHIAQFARLLGRRLYWQRDVYLYRYRLIERDRTQYLPRIESYELRVLETDAQADELVDEGFEDFRTRLLLTARHLSHGAVAFCVYVDKRLAYIGWVATDNEGKACGDSLPYRVAFADGEACAVGSYTTPEYRGRGLIVYGLYERFEYLRQKGYRFARSSIDVHNLSSQRANAKLSPEILGTGRFRRILCWSRWTERPLPEGSRMGDASRQ